MTARATDRGARGLRAASVPTLVALALAGSAWTEWAGWGGPGSVPDPPRESRRRSLAGEERFDPEGSVVRFLERRVAEDSFDFMARNKLAAHYLRGLEQTGELRLLERAAELTRESLERFPASRNWGGLANRTAVELASHEFEAAREHAIELIRRRPDELAPAMMRVDAEVELGQYEAAAAELDRVERELGLSTGGEIAVLMRRARLAREQGQLERERELYTSLRDLVAETRRQGPTLAWCQWQLGRTEFREGHYERAEAHHRAALEAWPESWRARAGLAQVRAAQGRLEESARLYERASLANDHADFAAARADVLEALGEGAAATAARDRAEALARRHVHLDPEGRTHFGGEEEAGAHDRRLALLWADRGVHLEEAYRIARADHQRRPDSHAAHALAWTALRAGRLEQAREAADAALRRGSREPMLLYHAAQCLEATGDRPRARRLLRELLTRNPHFDPLRADRARALLEEWEEAGRHGAG